MDPAATRPLGHSGVQVTQLGLGGASYGSLFHRVPEQDAMDVITTAWDTGVRYFDTAPWYGRGLSELRTGAGLRYRPRGEYVLSTKVGRWLRPQVRDSGTDLGPWHSPLAFDVVFDYSYDGIMRSVEQSQLRLGLPWYDVCFIHDLDGLYHQPDSRLRARFEELGMSGVRALAELREQGLIRAVGAGINRVGLIPRFLELLDVDVFLVAMPYTLLDQDMLDGEFAMLEERGISVVIGAPFASGLLAKDPGAGGHYDYGDVPEPVLDRVARMDAVCRRHGVPLGAAAIQFPFGHPVVAASIPGARSADQVRRTVELMQTEIPADLWAELKHEGLIRPDAPVPE